MYYKTKYDPPVYKKFENEIMSSDIMMLIYLHYWFSLFRVALPRVPGLVCHNSSQPPTRSSSSPPERNPNLATKLSMWQGLMISSISFY